MTEAEWLACGEPLALVADVRDRVTARRLRLVGCAAARLIFSLEDSAVGLADAADLGEQLADGVVSASDVPEAAESGWWVLSDAAKAAEGVNDTFLRSYPAETTALVRDIVGNPFRPAALDDACRTPAVVALARAAYDERHLPSGELHADRLAVLADALEDAGAAGDILTHLRGPGPHVRGCWALDLALGLS